MGVTDVFSYLKQSSTGAQIEQLLQSAIPLISHKKCVCGEQIAPYMFLFQSSKP